MRIFGWFCATILLMGSFKVIDVQVCVAGHGKCEKEEVKK